MSSTPNSQPAENFTVTVEEACVQPVVTSCIEPGVIVCVCFCPRLSVSVNVPATPVNTRRLTRSRGPAEKLNCRDTPVLDAK